MTIGVVMPAMLPKRLKTPPFSPISSFGEVSAITVQPSAPKPLPKNASDMSDHHQRLRVGVVAGDHRDREQHPGDDWRLAREGQRVAAPQQRVGADAAEHSADWSRTAPAAQPRSRLQNRHVPRLDQIDGKPGDEEVGQRVDAELADVDSHQHALAQQLATPAQVSGLLGRFLRCDRG